MSDNIQSFETPALLGTAEYAHRHQQRKQKEVSKLDDLVFVDTRPLYSCKSVFPFDLFPDAVTVDRTKISIAKRFFFFTRQTQSILIPDLLTIIVEETLLLASLHIVDRHFPQETIDVWNLSKPDARRVRWIVEGLLIGNREKVDFTQIPNEELLPKLEEIGKSKTT